jgi:hypothetical protein
MPSEQFADLSWCEQVTIWKDAVIVCFPLVIHTTLDSNHVGSLYKVSSDRHIWKATLVDIPATQLGYCHNVMLKFVIVIVLLLYLIAVLCL